MENNNTTHRELQKYSKNMFDKNGNLIPFSEQIIFLLKGELGRYETLILNEELCLPFKNLNIPRPLIIKQEIVKKIFNKHSIKTKTLIHISEKIKVSRLAIESKHNNILIFLDASMDNPKNPNLMCVININRKNPQNLEVNDIRSLYFDNVIKELENAKRSKSKIYTNQYTKKWLGLGLPSRNQKMTTPSWQRNTSHIINMITELSKNPSNFVK
jgi:hypothetical protein